MALCPRLRAIFILKLGRHGRTWKWFDKTAGCRFARRAASPVGRRPGMAGVNLATPTNPKNLRRLRLKRGGVDFLGTGAGDGTYLKGSKKSPVGRTRTSMCFAAPVYPCTLRFFGAREARGPKGRAQGCASQSRHPDQFPNEIILLRPHGAKDCIWDFGAGYGSNPKPFRGRTSLSH